MKQKLLLSLAMVLLLIPATSSSQTKDTWNTLVITEFRNASGLYSINTWAYTEFTNMGPDTLDLTNYWVSTSWGDLNNVAGENTQKATLGRTPGQKLPPGQSYVWAIAQTNPALNVYGDSIYPNGYINYEALMKADVVRHVGSTTHPEGELIGRHNVLALYYRGDTSAIPDGVRDSAMVDKIWYNASEMTAPNSAYPIAGVITNHPLYDKIYVRKFKFNKGNTNFDTSRGTNADDSEWQVLPRNIGPNDVLFTTYGKHMVQENLQITPKRSSITVNKAEGTISLPYDIPRDSIFRMFTYGDNHAWEFMLGPDTAKYFVSNGDSVKFYTLGNSLMTYKFAFKVAEKPTGYAKTAPLVYKNTAGNYTRRYSISDGYAPMDTIGQIPFNCPIDTLMDYLVISDDATTEFIWKNGVASPELTNGDILRITAGGNTKDYRLSVYPYVASSNSNLSKVIFPGLELWENPDTYQYTDTMLDFASNANFYIVNLPSNVKTSPAIIVTPQSANAKVYIKRASNLNGSEEERTISINVMAEDDSTETTYKFLLNVDRDTPPVVGEPFFCDVTGAWGGNAGLSLQIFNPLDETLRISDYMIMSIRPGETDFTNYITNKIASNKAEKALNSAVMRPGSYIQDDLNGDPYFVLDQFTTSEIVAKDVFSIGTGRSWPAAQGSDPELAKDKMDMVTGDISLNKNGLTRTNAYWMARFNGVFPPYLDNDPNSANTEGWLLLNNTFFTKFDQGATYALFKINNDSVKDGSKPVYKDFFKDFELVDVVNGLSTIGTPWKVNVKINGVDSTINFKASGIHHRGGLTRKANVYTGNPIDLGSFGTPGNEGEWKFYGVEYVDGVYNLISKNNDKGDLGGQEYGRTLLDNHIMITTAHIPYLTSTVYIISTGITTEETIYGVVSNTSVDEFMSKIIKPDAKMSVVIKSASGVTKEGTDPLAEGDKVTSTAANGLSSVTYTVKIGALSANTTLTTKSGAAFSISGTSITNVPFGMTLVDMMDQIQVPEFASAVITDGADYVIPMETYKADTLINERVNALVSTKYVIEVTAQNGIAQTKYSIAFKDEAPIYVLSDVYTVVEAENYINFVRNTNVKNFLANLIASPGATMRVINKLDQERTIGTVQFHDKLEVRKGNVVKIYYIRMFAETDERADDVKNTVALETSIYPNPTTGNITINGLKNATDLRIVNLAGQTIKTTKVNNETMNINLNVKDGVYFVTVMNKGLVKETHKIIVK